MVLMDAANVPQQGPQQDVWAVLKQMWEFADTKPSPQQTRQKTAREMVGLFASDLAAALSASRIDPPVPSPRLIDLQRICNLNTVQAMAVKGYIERWLAVSSSSVADNPTREENR